MAPKRGRFTVGSSSRRPPSPPPNYDVTKFRSEKAQEEYEKLMNKAVGKERGFRPEYNDGELERMIEERGWWHFTDTPPAVPLGIVREFYANAKEALNGRSWIRGRSVDYSAEAIRRIFDVEPVPEGVEDWTFKERSQVDLDEIVAVLCVPHTKWKRNLVTGEHVIFPSSAMNRYARAWNLFICANMLPSSHNHEVTVERAILLWGILKGEYIDVGYLIHQDMLRFMRGGTTGAIPHAAVVTRLCIAAGVDWDISEQVQQPTGDINKAAIARMAEWGGGTPHRRGLGYIIHESGAEADAYQQTPVHGNIGDPRTPGASVSEAAEIEIDHAQLSDQHYRRLTRRIDASHRINQQHAEDIAQVMRRVLQLQNYEGDWPVFGSHEPYPPPDSPPHGGPA